MFGEDYDGARVSWQKTFQGSDKSHKMLSDITHRHAEPTQV